MRNLARRAGRLALVPVLAGATMFGVAGPAVAAPPPEPLGVSENCSDFVQLAVVCVVVRKPGDGKAYVSALVRRDLDMRGALVVLEACDSHDSCFAQEVATSGVTRELRTNEQEWGRGTGYYRANASWVNGRGNAQGRTHTGVIHPDY